MNATNDGRHVGYLNQPAQWRNFDPDLFDALRSIVSSKQRHVDALEAAAVLPGATFASEVLPFGGPAAHRQQAGQDWFNRVQQKLDSANLLFLDPDNGLEAPGFQPTSAKAGKSIMLSEVHEFARPDRCLIVYHHQSRRSGGHHAEMVHWANRLRTSGFNTIDALRARPYSPRLYFLLDPPPVIRQRAQRIARDWRGCITWHPGGEPSR